MIGFLGFKTILFLSLLQFRNKGQSFVFRISFDTFCLMFKFLLLLLLLWLITVNLPVVWPVLTLLTRGLKRVTLPT